MHVNRGQQREKIINKYKRNSIDLRPLSPKSVFSLLPVPNETSFSPLDADENDV